MDAPVAFKTHGPKEVQLLIVAANEVLKRASAIQSTLKKIELDQTDAKEREGWAEDVKKRLEAASGGEVELNFHHREVLQIGLTIVEKQEKVIIDRQQDLLGDVDQMEDHVDFMRNLYRRLRQVDAPEFDFADDGESDTDIGDTEGEGELAEGEYEPTPDKVQRDEKKKGKKKGGRKTEAALSLVAAAE